MELSRRDLLGALSAVGVTASAGCLDGALPDDRRFDDHELDTLVAVAEVVYPSDVTGIRDFVETYSVARVVDRPEYAQGMRDAIATLDEYATDWFDGRVTDLSRENRDTLLDQMGVDAADPDPAGLPPERVRFYVVNDLLYAFYSTPTGAELVGIENPQGYPGGTTSYQRGPTE